MCRRVTEAEESILWEVAMLRRIRKFLGGLFLMLMVIGVVFLLGMRTKYPPVINAVRRVNRAVLNPRQMGSAGTPGAYASVIRHSGRTTGKPYETPVGAVPTDDGFVIALVYGTQSDWLKNVLAAGSATIVDEGHTYRVDQPEVAAIETVAAQFPPSDQRSLRLFGVDQALRVRRVEPPEPREEIAEPA
jgi:deazaflavin-dependent oxidoreductase (nitroreductase family)